MEKAQVIFWNTTINKIANILCFKYKKKVVPYSGTTFYMLNL